jgi:hypothetical protein
MERTWASPEYEDKILEEIHFRNERKLKIYLADAKVKQEIINKEIWECYSDPVYFIENYLYTDKNPWFFTDKIQTLVPFMLFDYQVETVDKLLEAVQSGERIFLEKSRQMWLSWLICAFSLWGWLFRDWKILFLSQKEDYVDKIWDMQSLFQKIRFMMSELPEWMMPAWFSIDTHTPRLRIYKPKGYGTGSISWESANKTASTWGTYKFVFMDEASKIENAWPINTALQATTWCIIYNWTPFWKFNEYYRMRILALEWKMKYVRLHWSLNPFYNKEWYEWRTKAMTTEQIAQELEISYDASVTGRVYPRFANIPAWDCKFWNYEYDPYLPLYCSIDNSHGWTDNHAIILAQTTSNGLIRIIDSLQLPSYTTIEECASLLAKTPKWRFDDEALNFLNRTKEYKQPIFIGDPYDSESTWNDTSISKIYYNYGLTLNLPDRKKWIQDRIRVCQLNMNRLEVNVNTESTKSLNWWLVSAMQNARYPERTETSQSTWDNFKPIHDASSHFRTSFEYLINFIVESEESLWIIWGKRQKDTEKVLVQKPNYSTWENEWVYES